MSIAKARTLQAKFQALTNAAEMIRSHGEEGFSFDDKKFDRIYHREILKLGDKLDKMSYKYQIEYKALGIEVNTEIDRNY